MKSRIMMSMLVIALAAAMVGGATMAWFTDSAVSEGNLFRAGTLSMTFDGRDGQTFQIDLGDLSNMQPGDETEPFTLRVGNNGSLDLALFRQFRMSGSDDLAKSLIVSTYRVKDWSDEFDIKDGVPNAWDIDGDGKYTLYDMTNRKDQIGTEGNSWFGIGLQAGQRSTGIYEVEFAFTFDPEAGNGVQGAEVQLFLDLVATQMSEDAILAEADGGLLEGINPAAVANHVGLWERNLYPEN